MDLIAKGAIYQRFLPHKSNSHWNSIIKQGQIKNKIPQAWTPPPVGFLKINADSTYKNGDAMAGLVVRNHNDTFLHASTHNHLCLDSNVAEGLALLDACYLLINLDIKEAIIESDSLVVISYILSNGSDCSWNLHPIIEKIRRCWNGWPSWVFKFASAHSLAKWALFCNFEGYVPLNLIPISVFCDRGHPLVNSI
ncbi:hypothetical protein CASFOL_005051 [Castilleja foliolosa]|uniref:RNase H type-1 domain-containing protein n=1 Tax=Castilleja foliolosa TaxID=1961234 RepID=A0ABD3E2N9_9LAMI